MASARTCPFAIGLVEPRPEKAVASHRTPKTTIKSFSSKRPAQRWRLEVDASEIGFFNCAICGFLKNVDRKICKKVPGVFWEYCGLPQLSHRLDGATAVSKCIIGHMPLHICLMKKARIWLQVPRIEKNISFQLPLISMF